MQPINRIILSGNEAFLKTAMTEAIANYQLNKNSEVEVTGGGSGYQKLPTYVRGKISVTLIFKGYIDNTTTYHIIEKSLYLMDDDPRTISQARIAAVAEKTYQKFFNPRFTFRTGHDSYCYNDVDQGFNRVWGFFGSQVDAKRLFEQMLDINGLSPRWNRLTRSTVVEPGDRFQEPPEKVMQANQIIEACRERPLATVKFNNATIKFPKARKSLQLVKNNGQVLKGFKVINDKEIEGQY